MFTLKKKLESKCQPFVRNQEVEFSNGSSIDFKTEFSDSKDIGENLLYQKSNSDSN